MISGCGGHTLKKENPQKDSITVDSSKQKTVAEVKDTFIVPPGFIHREEFVKLLPKDTIGISNFDISENEKNVILDYPKVVLKYNEFNPSKGLKFIAVENSVLNTVKIYKKDYIKKSTPQFCYDDTVKIKGWLNTGYSFSFEFNGKNHLIMDVDTIGYNNDDVPNLIWDIQYIDYKHDHFVILSIVGVHCNGSGCRYSSSNIVQISSNGKLKVLKEFPHFGGAFSYAGDFNKDGILDLIEEVHVGSYGGQCNPKDSSVWTTKFEFNCYTLSGDSLKLLKNSKGQSYGFWGCKFEEQGYMKLDSRVWFTDKKK